MASNSRGQVAVLVRMSILAIVVVAWSGSALAQLPGRSSSGPADGGGGAWTPLFESALVSPAWGALPMLWGAGTPAAGEPVSLTGGFNGVEGDIAHLVIGPLLDAPLHGGVLVPLPAMVVPIAVIGAGEFSILTRWPKGIPSGTALYVQVWTNEGQGAYGWSASWGLQVIAE